VEENILVICNTRRFDAVPADGELSRLWLGDELFFILEGINESSRMGRFNLLAAGQLNDLKPCAESTTAALCNAVLK
jgi:hypothetical protein